MQIGADQLDANAGRRSTSEQKESPCPKLFCWKSFT